MMRKFFTTLAMTLLAAIPAQAAESVEIIFSVEIDGERYNEPTPEKIEEVVAAFDDLLTKKAEADRVWTACKSASLSESIAQGEYTEAVDAALADADAAIEVNEILTAWRTARQQKEEVCSKVVEPTEDLQTANMVANNALVAMWAPISSRLTALEQAEPEVTEDDVDELLERIVALEEQAAVSSSIVDAVVYDCAWEHTGNTVCSTPAIEAAVEKVKAE